MENFEPEFNQPAIGATKIEKYINSLPKKEEFIDFSKLQKLGHGGTKDVFIYKRNPNFVIKISRDALQKAYDLSESPRTSEAWETVNHYVDEENSKNEELYKYFGSENCLTEKLVLAKISVEYNNWPREIDGVISVQEASNVFKNPTKLDFSTGYAEQSQMFKTNKNVYNKLNAALLGSEEFNEEDVFVFNEKLKPIFELADVDREFVNIIKEFLLKFKNYFETSGQFIDLVGQENVLFYQKEHKWFFQIGSVIKKENRDGLEKTLNCLEKNPNILNEDQALKNQLLNQLAVSRLINAMGIKIGLGKIIDIKLSKLQLENLDKVKF